MVQTEDQYQFCYRAALEYLSSFDTPYPEWHTAVLELGVWNRNVILRLSTKPLPPYVTFRLNVSLWSWENENSKTQHNLTNKNLLKSIETLEIWKSMVVRTSDILGFVPDFSFDKGSLNKTLWCFETQHLLLDESS